MTRANDYASVMGRKAEIMLKSVGIDYSKFESGSIAFDYEKMMRETGYTLEEMQNIQYSVNVGNPPILELKNTPALARACAPAGKGARIFIKDEAANPSGSFKARRAANAVYHAKKLGYKGVIAATSGNYGAAVASQAAIEAERREISPFGNTYCLLSAFGAELYCFYLCKMLKGGCIYLLRSSGVHLQQFPFG